MQGWRLGLWKKMGFKPWKWQTGENGESEGEILPRSRECKTQSVAASGTYKEEARRQFPRSFANSGKIGRQSSKSQPRVQDSSSTEGIGIVVATKRADLLPNATFVMNISNTGPLYGVGTVRRSIPQLRQMGQRQTKALTCLGSHKALSFASR